MMSELGTKSPSLGGPPVTGKGIDPGIGSAGDDPSSAGIRDPRESNPPSRERSQSPAPIAVADPTPRVGSGQRYGRVVLKVSGEAMLGGRQYGVSPEFCAFIAGQLADVHAAGVQVAIVVGGGNIFRGLAASAKGMDRATADHIGMLATVMNALALQDALEKAGVPTRVMTAIAMNEVAEPYIRRRAERHLEKGRFVILAAGTGNPYFTTDTAAALRAVEIDAQILLKATKVDAVYDADPKTTPGARRYDHLTYSDFLAARLQVLDSTAISLCMENQLPILVFNVNEDDNVRRAALGESVGTLIDGGPAT